MRLQASVIEARNILADIGSSLNFYVRLRVGKHTAKTIASRAQAAVRPLFLQDLRLNVSPEDEVLEVELLQKSNGGDLVIGVGVLDLSSLSDRSPEVCWYGLEGINGTIAAELCMVLRLSDGKGNTSRKTAYKNLARKEKERALAESRVSSAMQSRARSLRLPIPAIAAVLSLVLLGKLRQGNRGEINFQKDIKRLKELPPGTLKKYDLVYPGDRLLVHE